MSLKFFNIVYQFNFSKQYVASEKEKTSNLSFKIYNLTILSHSRPIRSMLKTQLAYRSLVSPVSKPSFDQLCLFPSSTSLIDEKFFSFP